MGCGGSIVPKCSDAQRNEMFNAASKEMMKMCLVDGYRNRDKIEVLAPSDGMDKMRKFAKQLHEASAVAREKCEDTMEGVTDKADELAAKAKEAAGGAGGMLGGMMGSALAGATAVAGAAADMAASGAGLAAEKAILLVATAMDEAISALDQPFKDVGKDIFKIKEVEIIKCYMNIIENARVQDAVKAVRGAAPYGAAEYSACAPGACCDLLQSVCQEEIHTELLKVVQEEIDKHFVTKAWDMLIEKYNEANAKLKTYKALEGFVGEPFKLDINVYISKECAKQFHGLMCEREGEIRKSPEGKSKEMPRMFHHFFSGDPAFDDFTMEHYANFRKK